MNFYICIELLQVDLYFSNLQLGAPPFDKQKEGGVRSTLLFSETLGLEYTGSGYMFGNCLTILFQYKSTGGVVDRDLVPEDSIYLTFNFRNLGEYKWKPTIINKVLNKNLRY